LNRRSFRQWLGMESHAVSHTEKWVAAAGALLGILVTALISRHFLPNSVWLMVGSMGASAVLLFAVPHGQLSQPWAASGGQLISAFVGVTCAHWIHSPVLAAAAAVSLAVLAMHYARCVHPPGGATALIAVIGGPDIHALGYGFIWKPVTLNALTILAMAFAFNNLFRWRRYPAVLQQHALQATTFEGLQVEREDVAHALQQINSPIDATEDDLLEIVHRAESHARERHTRSG
jgi:CBS domain-containing membrane protein